MKYIFLIGLSSVLLFSECGKKETTDKKAKLEELKKEYAALSEKIKTLENEMDSPSKAKTAIDVIVSPVAAEDFRTYLEVQGKVDARQNVDVSPKMPGIITSIFIKEGASVKKGQVLAEIDNVQIVKGVQELKQQLQFVTTIFEKQKNLWDQKIGSEIQFLQAKNNKDGLEKRLESLNEQLEMSKIKSPIDGTVDEVMIKIGQMAAPGYPAYRVVNFKDMLVVAEVAESYAGKVNVGDFVTVNFPDIDKTFDSKIDFVSKSINALNRTFKAEVMLGTHGTNLHPNMIATLKINDFEIKNAIVLPVSLIQKTEKGNFVMLNVDGKAVRNEITLGKSYGGKTVVVSGLKVGDELITSGYQDLAEGVSLSLKK